jgi:cyclopropane-fatty-acyl-phospholipid synthase
MLEAVGHDYLGDFYKATDRLLSENGLLVVQVITFPDHRYNAYRTSVDFIREYIFPGGLCPSNAALTAAMVNNSKFMVEHLENIGIPPCSLHVPIFIVSHSFRMMHALNRSSLCHNISIMA